MSTQLGRVFNVMEYGAVGDLSTDDTTAIQAAIDACETANGGVVFFPNPPSGYLTTAVLNVSGDGVTLQGQSRTGGGSSTLIQNVTTGVFDLGKTARIRWCQFKDLRLHSAGGDVIVSTFGMAKCMFENLFINGSAGNSALSYDGDNGSGVDFFGNVFLNCEFSGGPNQTVPVVNLTTNKSELNQNLFTGCVFTLNGGTITAPIVSIINTATSGYCYGNQFVGVTFEDSVAGAIHLNGGLGTVIDGIGIFDLSATTVDHMILLDDGTGNTCRGTTITGYLRAAGTLGGSLYDIQILAAQNTTIISPVQLDTGTDVTINVNDQPSTRIIPLNPPNVLVLNRFSSDAAYEVVGGVTLTWDHGIINIESTAATRIVTLPDNADFEGKSYLIRRDGSNTVTIDRAGSDTFDDGDVQKTLDSDSAAIGIFSIGDGEWKIVATEGTVGGS